LASLLDAGLPPRVALEQEGIRRSMDPAAHAAARQVLESGGSLADALARAGLDARSAACVLASESAGRASEGLRRIAERKTRGVETMRRALWRLAYPIFILHFAAFARGITRGLFVGNNGAGILAILELAVPIDALLLGLGLFARDAAAGGRCAEWARRVPFLGDLVRDASLASFLWSLRDLHDAGTPLDRAVDSASAGTPTFFRAPMAVAAGEVRTGQSLTSALARTALIDSTTLAILQPSEVAGMLAEGLGRSAILVDQRVARGLRAAAAIPGSLLYGIAVIAVGWTVYNFYVTSLPSWF
jgi:type II secretory pathway component PulF